MLRKSLILCFAAIGFCSPAVALTLQQAQAELAGMYCSGSSCTSSEEVWSTVDLPDTQLPDTVVSEGVGGDAIDGPVTCLTGSILGGTFDKPKCFPTRSLSPTTGGFTIPGAVIDGGTVDVVNCLTMTKTLTYNGPYTSRDGAWSIETSESSSAGGC